MKYLVSISYDGSVFFGWAKQKDFFTVQGFIEDSINSVFINKKRVVINGVSRTDKGVHAFDQKFTFSLEEKFDINISRMKSVLQKLLKDFIIVNDVVIVSNDFNISSSVIFKEYRYFIKLKNYKIFHKNYFFNATNSKIELSKLKKILRIFEGYHDFFNFSKIKFSDRLNVNSFREIKKIHVKRRNNEELFVVFVAKGFLRYQIRAILGECIDKHCLENGYFIIKGMLDSYSGNKYRKISPSSGLYLWKVKLDIFNVKKN